MRGDLFDELEFNVCIQCLVQVFKGDAVLLSWDVRFHVQREHHAVAILVVKLSQTSNLRVF